MKIFERILYFSIIFLIGFSVVCTLFGLSITTSMEWDISNTGLIKFITIFEKYGGIYLTTFAVIGVYLIIEQISLGAQANKISSRTEWRKKLDEKLDLIRLQDRYMYDHINLIADDIFDDLFQFDQKIKDKKQLKQIFDKFIKNQVPLYEEQSEDFIGLGGIYPQGPKSYSFKYFEEFLFRLLKPKWTYMRFSNDFRELYFAGVQAFSQDKKETEANYRMLYNEYQRTKIGH